MGLCELLPLCPEASPQSCAVPLPTVMLEVAWLRNTIPLRFPQLDVWRKGTCREREQVENQEREKTPKYFKPARSEGVGEVLV